MTVSNELIDSLLVPSFAGAPTSKAHINLKAAIFPAERDKHRQPLPAWSPTPSITETSM